MRPIALAVIAATSGCSGLVTLEGGYARAGMGSEAVVGGGGSGVGYQVRTKFGRDLVQVGVGPHAYLLGGGRFLGLEHGWQSAVFLRGGVDLLQFGALDGHGNVGIFSPYVDLGWLIVNPGVSLSVGAHYDVRLSSARNDLWLGAALGFGFGGSTL